MQTSIGTLVACAAVTFAVMLLTPTNKDGQPNQPGAVAQGDAFGGVEGGAEADPFGGLANIQPVKLDLDLSIKVVDCTNILTADDVRGNLMDRTASLAKAVEQTVAAVTKHGDQAIRVRPFEEFLIITATAEAFDRTDALLTQIAQQVANRNEIREMKLRESRAREQKESERMKEMQRVERERRIREDQKVVLEHELVEAAMNIKVLEHEAKRLHSKSNHLLKKFNAEHPDVQQIEIRLEEAQAKLDASIKQQDELKAQIKKLKTHKAPGL